MWAREPSTQTRRRSRCCVLVAASATGTCAVTRPLRRPSISRDSDKRPSLTCPFGDCDCEPTELSVGLINATPEASNAFHTLACKDVLLILRRLYLDSTAFWQAPCVLPFSVFQQYTFIYIIPVFTNISWFRPTYGWPEC